MASYDLKAILGEKLKRLTDKTLKALVDCMCTVGASLCSLDKRVSALESVELPEGGYKPMQEPVASPSASGTAIQFIESISQDATGRMTATKKTVQDGTTTQKGVVQLQDSVGSTESATDKAVTPHAVRAAIKSAVAEAVSNRLRSNGDASNTTSTFTKASGDTSSMTSGSKLSAIFTAISSFFASLKALAFKDKVGTSDIADDAITADKVKDNETLPVNVSGTAATATHLSTYGSCDTWSGGSYDSAKPYTLIAQTNYPITQHAGEGSLLQFEFGLNVLVRLKLYFITNNGSVQTAYVIVLDSTNTLTWIKDNIKITYFTYTSGTTTYVAIRAYVKFTSDWLVWRVRQFDCQTGDAGIDNWRQWTFFNTRGSDTATPVGTLASYSFITPFANQQVGSPTRPVYAKSDGSLEACTYGINVGSLSSDSSIIDFV